MTQNVGGMTVETDKEGHLKHLQDWNEAVAQYLAKQENIVLDQAHWEIIYLLREFYAEFELAPAMRALVKRVNQKLGEEKGRSVYLLQLFPPSPARIAAKIAGLPRPPNCF